MTTSSEFYRILGVKPEATDVEIRKAYRGKALELHPDKNRNDPKATEKFQQLNEAYETLKDPQKRKEYDLEEKKKKQAKERRHEDIFENFYSRDDSLNDLLRNLFGFSFRTNTNHSYRSSSNSSTNNGIDTVFIGGLPQFTTEGELLDAFAQFNPLRAKVVLKSLSKPAFGFVQFLSSADMRKALRERPNIFINGRICRVTESHNNLYDKKRRTGRFYF